MWRLTFQTIIDHWVTDFDIQAVRDIFLESLAVIGFLFILVVSIISMSKAPILVTHGSLEIFAFNLFGLIHTIMNVFDEFAWFTDVAYNIWKILKDLSLLLAAVILVIGFFRFTIFSARLFGVSSSE
ncbi:MAG: hypothetical protein U9O98_03120 [Asgard group archaeon]|nr:hypothetical protein [Asgard group archaeon]